MGNIDLLNDLVCIAIGNCAKFYSLGELCNKLRESLTMPTALEISSFKVFLKILSSEVSFKQNLSIFVKLG